MSCVESDDMVVQLEQTDVIKQIRKEKSTKKQWEKITFLKVILRENQRYALGLAAEKGASS